MDRAKIRALIDAVKFLIFGALFPGFICGNVSIVIFSDNTGAFITLLTVGMILPIGLHLYLLYKSKARVTFILFTAASVGLSCLILYSINKRLMDMAGFVFFFVIIPYIGIALVLITIYRLIRLRSAVSRPRSTAVAGAFYAFSLLLSCVMLVLGYYAYPLLVDVDIDKIHEIVRLVAMVIGFVAPLICYFLTRAYSKSLCGYIFIALTANAAVLTVCLILRSVFADNRWGRPGFHQYAQYCICFIFLIGFDLAVSALKRQRVKNVGPQPEEIE